MGNDEIILTILIFILSYIGWVKGYFFIIRFTSNEFFTYFLPKDKVQSKIFVVNKCRRAKIVEVYFRSNYFFILLV